MKHFTESLVVISLAAVAGCGTIKAAREAQDRLAPKGKDDAKSSEETPLVDLKGASLRALVDFALANRPSMRAAVLEVEDARLALKEIAADAPIASATPWNAADLTLSSSYYESSPSTHYDHMKHTQRGSASATLSLDLLIWDFGRNAAEARAQAENVIAAELNAIDEGYTVFNQVAEYYFTLLQNEALMEAAHTNVAEYVDHLEQAELKFELGEVKELDVTKARVDLAKSQQDLVSAQNDVVTAGANLMAALGIDIEVGDAKSVLGEHLGGLDRMLKALPNSTATAAEAYAFASTNAPAMKIARAKLRAASADVDYAIANMMPEVSASLSLNWTDPLWYWRWGFDAVQNLFTGFKRTTALDRARVALESAAVSVDSEGQQLSNDLELAIAERDNAAVALETAIETLQQSRLNLATVKNEYELGESSRVDFTDAVSDYTTALGDRITAYYRGQIAEAELYSLVGLPPEYIDEEWISE